MERLTEKFRNSDGSGISKGSLIDNEFKPFDAGERLSMIKKYMNSVDSSFITDEILHYAEEQHTQAEIINYLINKIVEKVS